jgi:hypothetical protein
MNNGVTYTIGMDGQQGIATMDAILGKFNLVSQGAASMGGKIQSALTFAGIEEAIRRTGEWAQGMDKAAIALGTTTEKLQSLQLMAQNANLDESKVTGWFDTLADKRTEAIKGNTDLIQSFQAMGVSMTDLQHLTKADLFSKVLGNQSIQDVVQGSPRANALENLIGQGNIPQFQALQKASGGKDLNQFTASGIASGTITKGSDITSMSNSWIQIKQDLASALKELTPLGKLLMSLATILSEAVLGLTTIFGGVFKTLAGILTGDFSKVGDGLKSIGATLLNGIFGVVKTFTGLIDGASNIIYNIAKHIPGLKSIVDKPISYTEYVQNAQDFYNDKIGANKNEIRGGEGLGNLAAVAATGGAGAAARMGSEGLLNLAGVAEKAGASTISDVMLSNAVRMEKFGGIGLFGSSKLGTAASWAMGAKAASNQTPNNGVIPSAGGTDAPYNGMPIYQQNLRYTGESNKQLSIGGVFGTGIQSKMIRLAEQQISILAQIQKNTALIGKFSGTNSNTTPSGGM